MERGIWQAMVHMGFPGDSVVKNMPVNAGDTGYMGLIFRWGYVRLDRRLIGLSSAITFPFKLGQRPTL